MFSTSAATFALVTQRVGHGTITQINGESFRRKRARIDTNWHSVVARAAVAAAQAAQAATVSESRNQRNPTQQASMLRRMQINAIMNQVIYFNEANSNLLVCGFWLGGLLCTDSSPCTSIDLQHNPRP